MTIRNAQSASLAPGLTRRSLIASSLVCVSGLARAQQPYPGRPITFVIPFTPGTGNDFIGRIVGKRVSELLGQPVVADNKAGASGNIAVDITRRAAPNGYTVLVGSVSFSINPFTMAGANYAVSDFTPIAMMGRLPFSLMVGKTVPANNIRELVALIKQKPGDYNGGQGGVAGTTYFLLEAFKKAAGVDVASISYKGTTETVVDLLAGRLHLMFAPVTTALPYQGSGEVKVFGVSGTERTPLMPDVPTFTELGFPSLDISTWFALIGPRGVPAADVEILSGAVAKALASDEVRESLLKNGITAGYGSPAELEKFLHADMARWSELAKASGIKPQ